MHSCPCKAQVTKGRVLPEGAVAKKAGVSKSYLRKLRYKGGGPAYIQLAQRRIGYYEGDVDTWLDDRRVPATEASHG